MIVAPIFWQIVLLAGRRILLQDNCIMSEHVFNGIKMELKRLDRSFTHRINDLEIIHLPNCLRLRLGRNTHSVAMPYELCFRPCNHRVKRSYVISHCLKLYFFASAFITLPVLCYYTSLFTLNIRQRISLLKNHSNLH